MEPITIAITGITIFVTAAVGAAVKHYQTKVARKNAEIEKLRASLEQYASTYQFEDCDLPVINAVKNYLGQLRKNGSLAEIMRSMDLNDRRAYMVKVVREIAKTMDIELHDVNIVDLGFYVFGQAYINEGRFTVDLNEALLIADPDALLKTVCHELRHLQQLQALCSDKWGFSNQRKAQWMAAYDDYVRVEECTENQYVAYARQSIEVDANMFAEAVIS